jgi:hypothetical protein
MIPPGPFGHFNQPVEDLWFANNGLSSLWFEVSFGIFPYKTITRLGVTVIVVVAAILKAEFGAITGGSRLHFVANFDTHG